MDPNATINVLKLSEIIRRQAETAKSEETKVALAGLVTDIGTWMAEHRAPGFNLAKWIETCGITPDFKRAGVAA